MTDLNRSQVENIIGRQLDISTGVASRLNLPVFDTYAICNLRGGIGKTSLTFNLSYLADDVLAVDTCPQGNLSYFYDTHYFNSQKPSVYELILPHIMPGGLGKPGFVAQNIAATNEAFNEAKRHSFFIPSSSMLYVLPSQLTTAINQTNSLSGNVRVSALDNILLSLNEEIRREMKETRTSRCLIDTSPFFSGGTHLVWHATDASIVPVRTDQQSINSLNLLLNLMSQPSSEFRRFMPSNNHCPKIQFVVLTHCGWSTRRGAQNVPNQQTRMYTEQIFDIVNRNIQCFTTEDPTNHIVILDDFLGSGRISSARAVPIDKLTPGETMSIHRTKVEVNQSVEKIKHQLRFISKCLWG